jgi:uncharacterized repeat protein (TIGR01451 family)
MKKHFTVVFFLIAGLKFSSAQTVTIPDANFVNALTLSPFSSCMSGNLLDTICVQSQIASGDTILYVASQSIINLDGIQYFNGLKVLNCANNFFLNNIPSFPSSLDSIDCHSGLLTTLPSLPTNLRSLHCEGNQLTTLPPLPGSLINLSFGYNSIPVMPILPDGIKYLYIQNNSISTIPSLPDSLEILDCSNNLLTSLPALPTNLSILVCYINQLTSLPTLPNNLTYLDCTQNEITSLPTLPNSINNLLCMHNLLTGLPALPTAMTWFDCSHNQINSLPSLPDVVGGINVSYNQLSSLPPITFSTQQFNCSHNNITSLITYPNLCSTIDCSYNLLTTIPAYTYPYIWMNCSHNLITTLPAFLDTMYIINCSNNLLTSLPELPLLMTRLNIDSNNISCLPELHAINDVFSFIGNPISCIPNFGNLLTTYPNIENLPLCYPGNPNNCTPNYNIAGYVYNDFNINCSNDSMDFTLSLLPIRLYQGLTLISQQYPVNGMFAFNTSLNNYNLSIDTSGIPLDAACASHGLDTTINVIFTDSIHYGLEFGLNCKTGFDVGTNHISMQGSNFPGLAFTIFGNAGDYSDLYGNNLNCADGESGQIIVHFSGPISYIQNSLGSLSPSTVIGNTITYDIADFGSINFFSSIGLVFETDTTAVIGDSSCFDITIIPMSGDNNTTNNYVENCFNIGVSFDPNNKQVYPIGNVNFPYNDNFTYTINFQNTGSAPAMNISLRDTLDVNFDPETFRLITSSHSVYASVTGNNMVFNFPNIMLPDSNSNEPASHGFIQYQVKPFNNLPIGTEFNNTAYIYFDYNDPIITNTTSNSIEVITSINQPELVNVQVTIFPNPSSSFITINSTEVISRLYLLDLNGKVVIDCFSNKTQATINTENLSAGIYFARIITDEGLVTKRLIVQ